MRGLDFARRIANPRAYTGVCETTAYIAVREADAELAARLLGAAEAGRIMSGAPIFPYWVKPHDEAWTEVCALLGTTAAQDLFAAESLRARANARNSRLFFCSRRRLTAEHISGAIVRHTNIASGS